MSVSASCRSASGRRRRPAPWLRFKGDPWALPPGTLLSETEGPDETLAMPGGRAGDRGFVRRLLGGTRLQTSRDPGTDGLAQWPGGTRLARRSRMVRSEEHTSELQSPCNLVCRLLLEKKKRKKSY